MRIRWTALVCVCALVGCVVAGASAADPADPPPPKPGPEHARLGFFAGKWTSDGFMHASPFGPGGKTTGKDDCDWFEGKFAIVCRSENTNPLGKSKSMGILSYSPEEKVYTYYGLDSTGMTMSTVPRGTVDGKTWTFTDESMMEGKKVKSRYIIQETSPTSSTFKWEILGDDGKWITVAEGKQTKVN